MGTVTSFTKERILRIENSVIVRGYINAAGFLVLVTKGGTEIEAGYTLNDITLLEEALRDNALEVTAALEEVAAAREKIAELETGTLPALQEAIQIAQAAADSTVKVHFEEDLGEGVYPTLNDTSDLGDLYYRTDGQVERWMGSTSATPWILVQDTVLAETIQELRNAQGLLHTLEEVTLPALRDDLTSAEETIVSHTTGLATLDGRLSESDGKITIAQDELNTLKTQTIPGLNQALTNLVDDLATERERIDTLNSVTLPALNEALIVERGRINTLNTVTIPELNTAITTEKNRLDTLVETTIPDLDQALIIERGRITTLVTTTIPDLGVELDELQGELTTAKSDISTVTGTVTDLTKAGGTLETMNTSLSTKLAKVNTLNGVKSYRDLFTYYAGSSVRIGTLAVKTGITFASAMLQMKISISQHQRAESLIDLSVYAQSGGTPYQPRYSSYGAFPVTVRFARSADSKLVLLIDNLLGDWSYVRMSVSELLVAYAFPPDVELGWTANVVTDLTPYVAVTAAASSRDLNDTHVLTQGWRTTGTTTIDGGKITADTITAGQIKANAITASELAAEAVYAAAIQANAVTANAIAADAVTADKIKAGEITAGKLAADAVVAANIAAGAITTAKLAAGAVTANEIAALAVTTAKIAAGAVTADEIAAGAITAIKIEAGAVIAGKLAADSVVAANIKAGEVVAGKLAVDAVVAANIAAGAITTIKLAADAVTADKIAANTITANEIAANAITASELAADAVTATKIKAGEVVAGKLATDSVVAANIKAGEITTIKLAADAVTAEKIAAGEITSREIAANSIAAEKLLIGDFSNYFNDPTFSHPSGYLNWTVVGSGLEKVGSGLQSGGYYASTDFPVAADENLIFSINRQNLIGSVGDASLYIQRYGPTGTLLASAIKVLDVNVAGASVSQPYKIVAGTAKVRVGLYVQSNMPVDTKIRLTDLVIRKQTPGTLIEQDTITTGHVKANAITANEMATGTITAASGIIANAAITEAKIADLSVTNAKVTGLSATKLTTDTLAAERLAARSITAEKLVVMDATNYFNDPLLVDPAGYPGWTVVNSGLERTSTGVTSGSTKPQTRVGVIGGDRYRWSIKRTNTGSADGLIVLLARYFRADGTQISFVVSGSIGTTGTTEFVIPAGAVAAEWGIRMDASVPSGTIVRVEDITIRRMSGGDMIIDGAITTAKMIAGSINGDRIAVGTLNADRIQAFSITSDKITGNDITGKSFRGSSFIITDAEGTEQVNLSPGVTGNFATFGSGDKQATVGSDGSVSASAVVAETLYYKGDELSAILEKLPKGVLSRSSSAQFPPGILTVGSEVGLSEIRFQTPVGSKREYRVKGSNLTIVNTTRGAKFTVRMTTDGTRPTISSTAIGNWEFEPDTQAYRTVTIEREYALNGGLDVRMLLTMSPGVGTGNTGFYNAGSGVELSIVDEGLFIERTGVISNGGATGASPTRNYDVTYQSNWLRSYMGSGAPRSVGADNTKAYQGYTSYWPAGGNQRSMFGFPTNLQTDLSGATITSMEVYLYFEHWQGGAGGTAAIGVHGNVSAPATSTGITGPILESGSWPRGSGRWVYIPSQYWAGFASGSYRGIALYKNDNNSQYYGYAANDCRLRVRYTK